LRRSQIFSAVYYAICAVLLGTLVWQGLPGLWIDIRSARVKWPRVSYSTDAFFSALLDAPNGAESCLDALAQLPADRPLLFICPKQDARWDFVYGLISSISWPRDIRKENLDPTEFRQRIPSLHDSGNSAVIFCGIDPPPAFSRGWRIGRQLIIVPLEAAK
jgi:hypothetical protein